ncbi:MAG: choice-of-anchor C family protein [Rhodoferax sp.]
MKFQNIAIVAAIALSALASNAHAELVINGSFESYTLGSVNGFQTINAGSTALTGWTVGATSVDIINGSYGAVSGNSIDMLGTPGPGFLSQMLFTEIGQLYFLTFDMSSNRGGDNNALGKELTIGALGNQSSHTFSALTPGVSQQSYSFVANSTSTLLSFSSGPSGYSGSVLDNVSVTAVPEPETYAMMLAGLGLMGAIARRRKAKQA